MTAAVRPPITVVGPVAWARNNLFNGLSNTITTIVLLAFLAYVLPMIYGWAIGDAVLTVKPSSDSWWGYEFAPDAAACRVAEGLAGILSPRNSACSSSAFIRRTHCGGQP